MSIIARVLTVERTISMLHSYRWCRPLCSAQSADEKYTLYNMPYFLYVADGHSSTVWFASNMQFPELPALTTSDFEECTACTLRIEIQHIEEVEV
jgi:hypothetical protein